MWRHLAPVRGQLTGAAAVGALTTMSNVALLGTSAFLIARAAQMPPVLELTVAVVSVRALALLRSIGRYTERLVAHDATFRSLAALRTDVYRNIERVAPSGLGHLRRGDVVARLVSDVDRMQDLPLRTGIPVAVSAVSALATAIAAFALLPSAGAVVATSLAAAAVAGPVLAVRTASATESAVSATAAAYSDDVLEFLDGQADLAMLGAMPAALRKLEEGDRALKDSSTRLAAANGLAAGALALCQAIAVAGSSWAAAHAVLAGTVSPVTAVVIGLLPLAAFETVAGLPGAALAWVSVRASWQRIAEFVGDAEQTVNEAVPGVHSANRQRTPAMGVLELEGVVASWPGGSIVGPVGARIAPSAPTALVGPSGAGKSTVLAVLAGFLRPISGRYLLDGLDTAELPGAVIRDHVTLSLQDGHVFATSVAENLRLAARNGANTSDEVLAAALHAVGLGPWLDGLPHGLDTVLGENGATMSGGQRQRLFAARMLVADPDVWLLDEPTEHLDAQGGDDLVRAVIAAAGGRTIMVSSHRSLDIAQCSDVVHIDGTMSS